MFSVFPEMDESQLNRARKVEVCGRKGTCPPWDWHPGNQSPFPFLLPSSFLSFPPPFLLPPIAFTISASYTACSHPLFHLPLIRSYTHEGKVTNSILQMNKTKQSSGSRAKPRSFPTIQFYVPFLSTPFSIQHASHPASLLHLTSRTGYSDSSGVKSSGQSILQGPRGRSLH